MLSMFLLVIVSWYRMMPLAVACRLDPVKGQVELMRQICRLQTDAVSAQNGVSRCDDNPVRVTRDLMPSFELPGSTAVFVDAVLVKTYRQECETALCEALRQISILRVQHHCLSELQDVLDLKGALTDRKIR